MFTKLRHLLGLAAAVGLATAAAAPEASATTAVALTGDSTIVSFNIENRRVTRRVTAASRGRLVGIDVRPANGLLYGLVANGRVVTIDPNNGIVTEVSRLSVALSAAAQFSVDFNPVPDRLRIIGVDGTSLRANVDTGATLVDSPLNFAQPNPFGATGTPAVIAAAYSNPRAGTLTTSLFDIDDATAALYLQLPPNAGTLNAIGLLGVDPPAADLGFDIYLDGRGRNQGIVVSNRRLSTVDFAGGALISVGTIRGLSDAVRDVAVLPR